MKKRMAEIELLRIVSMLMIVLIHLLTKTSLLNELQLSQPVYYVSWFLYGICMTGVNCYILISGYFGDRTEFKLEKLFQLYFQVWFYSVVISLVMWGIGVERASGWREVLLPITNREYWFATVYIGLYCLIPFLNHIQWEERQLRKLLIILGIMFSVIPTLLHANDWLEDGGAYGIVWFVFLYLLGVYIKKFYQVSESKAGLWYLIAICIIPISKFIIVWCGRCQNIISQETVAKVSEVLYCFNSLPALLASVFLFVFFCKIKIRNEVCIRMINFVSSLTFGIYLIHNNRNFSRFLWEKLRVNYWMVERENAGVVLGILICVFIGCGTIEWIRQWLFKVLRINQLIKRITLFAEEVPVLKKL